MWWFVKGRICGQDLTGEWFPALAAYWNYTCYVHAVLMKPEYLGVGPRHLWFVMIPQVISLCCQSWELQWTRWEKMKGSEQRVEGGADWGVDRPNRTLWHCKQGWGWGGEGMRVRERKKKKLIDCIIAMHTNLVLWGFGFRYSFFVAMGYLTICHVSRIYIFHYGILTTDFSGWVS